MHRYSEVVKADVRRRISPAMRQSVIRISEELDIHLVTLYTWRNDWRFQGEVVPASVKEPEGRSAADKVTVVLETAGLSVSARSIAITPKVLQSVMGAPECSSGWWRNVKAATEANGYHQDNSSYPLRLISGSIKSLTSGIRWR
jgi:transposase-like protein